MASTQALNSVRLTRRNSCYRRRQAAKAACAFLRMQAEYSRPANPEELVEKIWMAYWRMEALGLLVAPRLTRRLLRNRYGFFPKPVIVTC